LSLLLNIWGKVERMAEMLMFITHFAVSAV
jgi:hypothetical protein